MKIILLPRLIFHQLWVSIVTQDSLCSAVEIKRPLADTCDYRVGFREIGRTRCFSFVGYGIVGEGFALVCQHSFIA